MTVPVPGTTPPTEGAPAPSTTPPPPTEGAPPVEETDLDKAKRQAAHWQRVARDHEKAVTTANAKITELEASTATEAEKAVAKARAEGAAEAEATWKTRWTAERRTTEALTALTAKVRNPRLLLPHLNLSTVTVAEDGTVDATALGVAVDGLLEQFPDQKLTGSPPSGDIGPKQTATGGGPATGSIATGAALYASRYPKPA